MSLLQPAKPENAYLKMGIYGEAGSGKTFTSSLVATGLHGYLKAEKPVAFFDTETGSDFIIPLFEKQNVPLLVAKTRAFKDLLELADEAVSTCSIMIVDSISHFWNEMCKAYKNKKRIEEIELRDWIPLKEMWREWSDRFSSNKIHTIMAGRSADEFGMVYNERKNKLEMQQLGTRMRAEREMGYEPNISIEMRARQRGTQGSFELIHTAIVWKDRANILNGQEIEQPNFESFLPHIKALNIGGEHKAIEPDRSSEAIFSGTDYGYKKRLERDILLEEIKAELELMFPSKKDKDKKALKKCLKDIFDTYSWTAIGEMKNKDLKSGLETIRARKAE